MDPVLNKFQVISEKEMRNARGFFAMLLSSDYSDLAENTLKWREVRVRSQMPDYQTTPSN